MLLHERILDIQCAYSPTGGVVSANRRLAHEAAHCPGYGPVRYAPCVTLGVRQPACLSDHSVSHLHSQALSP